jgi:organic hydroperoxide reductase OsmC/OhrA
MAGRHGHDVHTYDVAVTWTGNRGVGTTAYDSFGREHEVRYGGADGAPGGLLDTAGPAPVLGSADPAFGGDPRRWNPEQLLVAALSQCHMLWFLHLAAAARVVVTAYEDSAHGVMVTDATGGGQFERVVLSPVATIALGAGASDSAMEAAQASALTAHHRAHELCFIARSVNFPVEIDPEFAWS